MRWDNTERWHTLQWLLIGHRGALLLQPQTSGLLNSKIFSWLFCYFSTSLFSVTSETKFVSLLSQTAIYWQTRTSFLRYPQLFLCVLTVSCGNARTANYTEGYYLLWKLKYLVPKVSQTELSQYCAVKKFLIVSVLEIYMWCTLVKQR